VRSGILRLRKYRVRPLPPTRQPSSNTATSIAFDLTGRSRIFHGDSRSEGKIVSLFEPSAEVIRKGKASKLTEFGKLVKLQEAENQIIRPPFLD
jgi:hypothetical protein